MQDKEKAGEQHYPGSVLLSDHIKSLVNEGLLIVDNTFDEGQLRRAKYQIRLGKRYFKDGKYGTLDENNPILKIEPFDQVLIESYENFNMPCNVVAQYDLIVSYCWAGLGLQTGLQIDPTYYGKIFCPIFNFSDASLILKYKKDFASVAFIFTTPPHTPETNQPEAFEQNKYGNLSLHQVVPNVPRGSGLVKLYTELKSFYIATTSLNTRVDTMIVAVLQGMAFLIAALGVMAAAMSIAMTSKFLVWPFPLLISIIILFVIAFGSYAFIRKAIRKASEDK